MELIANQDAKNTSFRLGFTYLLAAYCLSAIFTSVPLHKTGHHGVSAPALAPGSPLLAGSVLAAKRDNPKTDNIANAAPAQRTAFGKWWQRHEHVATQRNKWWQQHQSVALLQGKWWQQHQNGPQGGKSPVRLAHLSFGPLINQTVRKVVAFLPPLPDKKPQRAIATRLQRSDTVRKPADQGLAEGKAIKNVSLRTAHAELLPALVKNAFKRQEIKQLVAKTHNQCVEGKIAGWSGIKLLDRHKVLLQQSGTGPQEGSAELLARLQAKGFTPGSSVFLRIFKDKSELQIWLKKDDRYALFRAYKICRWSGSFGPKLYEGDKQSPEGFYEVDQQLFDRRSWKWKDSFSIGYPNAYDKLHGRTGSLILVHGGCTSSGCFAMTDPVIQEVHQLAQLARDKGQDSFSVHVYPFKLTTNNLKRHKNSPWMPFWNNLKEGYDLFEKTGLPPKVRVCNKRYVFAGHEEQPTGARWSGKGCYGLAAFIPGWKPASRFAKKRVNRRARRLSARMVRRARRAGVKVRCNTKRASCRKWVALKSKKAGKKRRRSVRRQHRSRTTASRRRANMRRARAIGRRSPKVQLAH